MSWLFLAGIGIGFSPATWAQSLDWNWVGFNHLSKAVIDQELPPLPEELSQGEVEFWVQQVEISFLRQAKDQGFFGATIHSTVQRLSAPLSSPSQVSTSPEEWEIEFKITEGPQYQFGTLALEIAIDSTTPPKTFPERNAWPRYLNAKQLRSESGELYNLDDLLRDRRTLTRQFSQAGFVNVKLGDSSRIDDKAHRVDITFRVQTGQAVIFDTLILRNTRARSRDTLQGLTRSSLLRDLVPYARGDTLRGRRNEALIEKLQYTGVFNFVRLEDSLTVGADGRSALILRTEEKIPGSIRGELFYETQYGAGLSGEARHGNVAGTLNDARVGAGLAWNKQHALLAYGSPLTFGQLLRFDNELTVEWFQDKLPDANLFDGDFRAANIASLSKPVTRWLRLLSGAELEYAVRYAEAEEELGALRREYASNFNWVNSAFISFLDKTSNPAKGWRAALTWGNGGPIYEKGEILIGQDRHNWVEAKNAWYWYPPGLKPIKLAARLDGGRFFGVGGLNAGRFLLGGPRNVRSRNFQTICPDQAYPGEGNCPVKDKNFVLAYGLGSAELRLSPFDFSYVNPKHKWAWIKPLELVAFVDYGKVWDLEDEAEDFTQETFYSSGFGLGKSAGFGFRYPLLGIFNLRLDFPSAWGADKPWTQRWILDLAQAF
jgi:outer membrane protein assembly factor BamA